jgi:hypothetical protein
MHARSQVTNESGEFHYKVRVRPTTLPTPPQCLWGSATLLQTITFPKPLILHISNDPFGAPITFGTQVVSGPPPSPPTLTAMGTLQPGECVSIPIQGYSGVFANCAVGSESTVECLLKASV